MQWMVTVWPCTEQIVSVVWPFLNGAQKSIVAGFSEVLEECRAYVLGKRGLRISGRDDAIDSDRHDGQEAIDKLGAGPCVDRWPLFFSVAAMSSSGSHRIPASAKAPQSGSTPASAPNAPAGAQRAAKPDKSNKCKDFLLTIVVLVCLLLMTLSVIGFVSIIATGTFAFGYELEEVPYVTQQFAIKLYYELVPPEWIPQIGPQGRGFLNDPKNVGDLDYHKLRTIDERMLSHFDGRHKGALILLSITGLVFNVSSGAAHYQQGGGYNFLSGKDATVSFVTGCFDAKCFETQAVGWDAVDAEGARAINDWLVSYKEKYPIYAKLDKVYELYHTDHPSQRHSKFLTPVELHRERAQQAKNVPEAVPFKAAKLPKMTYESA